VVVSTRRSPTPAFEYASRIPASVTAAGFSKTTSYTAPPVKSIDLGTPRLTKTKNPGTTMSAENAKNQ